MDQPPSEAAPAKVNLSLAITGRRADGYHFLDSLVVFAGASDQLTASPAADFRLTITGPFAPGLADDDGNLVLRAARALAAHAGIATGAHLTLTKNLPIASGIGGGSADAAATLRLLARLWHVSADLTELALTIGADVPVCLASQAARMSGIGDRLAPAPDLPPCGLLLVNPGLAVATAAVFRTRTGRFSPPAAFPAAWPTAAALAADLAATSNDLQAPAIALCPAIAEVLAAIQATDQCRFARMSGSGATCFGLFDTPRRAAAAAARLSRPTWWTWGGSLHPAPSHANPLAGNQSQPYCTPADWGVAKR